MQRVRQLFMSVCPSVCLRPLKLPMGFTLYAFKLYCTFKNFLYFCTKYILQILKILLFGWKFIGTCTLTFRNLTTCIHVLWFNQMHNRKMFTESFWQDVWGVYLILVITCIISDKFQCWILLFRLPQLVQQEQLKILVHLLNTLAKYLHLLCYLDQWVILLMSQQLIEKQVLLGVNMCMYLTIIVHSS